MDLSGAFHLLFFRPKSALWMLSALAGGLSVVWHTGNFGHSHTPHAFQAISKFIERVVNERGRQRGRDYGFDVYVDDLMGVCFEGMETLVRDEVYSVIRELLGSRAVAEDKTEWGRRLVFVGWDIDLDSESVFMAEHIVLKLVYHMDQIRAGKVSGRSLFEVMAALVERLSAICPLLNAFKGHLYGNYCRLSNMSACVELSPLSLMALALARRVVVSHAGGGAGYPFSFFIARPKSFVVEFDGSIYGAGCRVFEMVDGLEALRAEVSLDLPPEVATTEKLRTECQNGNELLAVVLGLHVVHYLSGGSVGVGVRGDSEVALSWISTNHFKSPFAHRSALAWILLESESSMQVVSKQWISKNVNLACDAYSRRIRPVSTPGVLSVVPESTSPLASRLHYVVACCNPLLASSPLTTLDDLGTFFDSIPSTR